MFPEDGTEPILLPYPDGSRGLACDHALLVSSLREAIEDEADVDFISHARVNAVDDERVAFSVHGDERSIAAARIVGADGRTSIVRRSLGLSTDPILCSWMLGVTIDDAGLPFEGYGHVVLGGPGPILMYGLADGCVRVIVDLPLDRWTPRDRIAFLSESCAGLLPGTLGPAFVEALRAGRFQAAANRLRPRVTYGSPRRVLIGDAAGHYHPMTAVGMTLGFGDALTLVDNERFRDFIAQRFRAIRFPEFLAMGVLRGLRRSSRGIGGNQIRDLPDVAGRFGVQGPDHADARLRGGVRGQDDARVQPNDSRGAGRGGFAVLPLVRFTSGRDRLSCPRDSSLVAGRQRSANADGKARRPRRRQSDLAQPRPPRSRAPYVRKVKRPDRSVRKKSNRPMPGRR